ncbi:hypothetical protein T484DRAFT_2800433 [Baffinella frigidus]|nr:hypothetical protein T484DRAFT_2800433 [Cryptophyta sp. CCMP2293]
MLSSWKLPAAVVLAAHSASAFMPTPLPAASPQAIGLREGTCSLRMSEGPTTSRRRAIEKFAGAVVLAGAAGAAPALAAEKKAKPVFLGEGLSYIIKKSNESPLASLAPAVQDGDFVIIDYIAYLKDGTIFDNTKKRGKPLTFQVGKKQSIVGLEKGLYGMKSGEQRMLFIPSKLAYGEVGVCIEGDEAQCLVPPNTDIVYDLELVRVPPLGPP